MVIRKSSVEHDLMCWNVDLIILKTSEQDLEANKKISLNSNVGRNEYIWIPEDELGWCFERVK